MARKRLSGFILLWLFFSSLCVICSAHATPAENDPRLSVKIAVLANFPPQYALDDNGKPTGFAVDVMNQVARLANLDPDYVVFQNWPDAQQALRSGAVDIVPNMGITERRQAFADFTSPVETFPVSIFIRQAESGINGAQDLPGHKVVVVEVNVGYALLKGRPDIQLVIAHNPSEAIMFLLSAQADALVFPQPVIDQLARKSGIENKLKVVGKPLKEIVRGIAVQKGRDDLLGRLDAAVKRFVATEAYSRIYVRWYGAPEAYWTVGRLFNALGLILGVFAVGMFVMRHITLFRFNKTLKKRVQERTAELTASEQQFRLLFENASFGIAVHDLVFDEQQKPVNYVFTNANPAFYKILGLAPGSAPGQMATDLFGVPDAPNIGEFSAVALGNERFEKEIEFDPMGIIFKLSVYSHRPKSFVTVFEDITDRKRLEKDHRKTTQHLLAIYNTVPVGILLVKDRIVLEANPCMTQLLGYETAEIIGQETRRFYIDDEEWRRIGHELDTGLATSNLVSIDARVRHKDGSVKYALMTCSRLSDETPPIILAALQDITDRKEMEEALKVSEGRFREIIDSSPMPLSISNDHGKILYTNPAFVDTLGYTLEDIPTIDDFWHKGYPDPAYREEVIQKWWQRVIQSEKELSPFAPMEVRICGKDSSTRIMLATSTLLSGFAEKTRLVTLYDITQLKIMSQRLKTLLAMASDGIHVMDEQGNIVEFSDSFARMLGYTVEETARLNVADWEAQIPRDELTSTIKDVFKTSSTFETKHRRKDGSVFEAEINAKSIVLDGRLLLYGSSRDISERKEIEKALRQSEAKFRQLFQVAAIPLCHVRRDGVILALNSKFIETFGYDRADIPTLDEWRENAYPDPEYRKSVIDTWEAALQQAMKNQTNIQAQEYQVTCKNGDVRSVLISGSTFEEYFLATFVDITERKNAERSLRYYEKIASTVDTLLYLVDRDGIFLQVNDALARILGRKREEIVGQSMAQIAVSDNYSRMKPQIKRCLAGETVSQKMWIDWPDGTKRFFHIIRYPMFDDDGTVYAVAGVGHDMTETYQANEALTKVNKELIQVNEALQSAKQTAESANRAKSIFLSNISHELRTPLNAILGYTQILTADKSFGEKQQSGLQTIHQAGEHLLMIINDVLDMSKIEAGMLQLVPTKIQLRPFFDNIIDFFKYRAREKGLSVTFETDQTLSFVIVADELRLRQVIFNLLSNAIKFTAKGYCRLHVEAKSGQENRCRLKIAVEDSGVGIPKEQQDEVFDPFKQVGERLQYKEGSGLGLAISRQLVHLMGGELAVSSPVNASPANGAGVGSRFSFSIEAQVVETGIPTAPSSGRKIIGYEHTGQTNQPVKILIVDDKMSNRAVLRDTLRPLGFATQEAEDGSMVTQICLKTHPDLILMDLRMPNIDGFSAMNQLKHHDDLKDIPVVAVTASTAESDMLKKRCIQRGFKAFILKPFVTSDLLESIAELLPITLIYQETDEQEPPTFSKIDIPHSNALEKLSASLAKGDIEGILEQAEAIGGLENGKYQDFSQTLSRLANDFKFSEIETLISSREDADD
ncbi:two component system sensor kinase, hybrid [Desulfosarcina variabilis str. Montpellier]|uniref:PAS domain S-box protein n=1 Tax=Desulfosarcina variabilis TaxID=2300 RepID=UPI003AFB000A